MSGRPIYAAAALVAAVLFATTGCGRRATARVPSPAKPAPIGWTQTGIASWYGIPYDGRHASDGEIFDMRQFTAAHRTLPFDTWVRVTNLENGKRVDVRINDRGPFVKGRILDLSMAAANRIDMIRSGTARVRLKVIKPPRHSAAGPVSKSGQEDGQASQESGSQENRSQESGSQEKGNGAEVNAPGAPAAPATEENGQTASGTADSESGRYAVQVGAYSDQERANAFASMLNRPDVRVVEVESKTTSTPTLWRVLVGRKLTRDAAEGIASQIRESGRDTIVVVDPGAGAP